MKYIRHHFIPALLAALLLLAPRPAAADSAPQRPADARISVLATTYPVWLLTRAVACDVPAVDVQLLIAAATGCPHDYAPTPADLLRLEKAQLVIINGLGMESALQAALAQRAGDVLDCGAHLHDQLAAYAASMLAACEGHHHHHDHAAECGPNPHIFAGPRLAVAMTGIIADELARRDPAHAERYRANAARFAEDMTAQLRRLERLAAPDNPPRVILQHDGLAYFAADAGLKVLDIVQEDDERPTASRLMELLARIRAEKPELLLAEAQFADKTMSTLAGEGGTPLLQLDSLASGREDVPADHYVRTMRENINRLEESLARPRSF